MSRTDIEFKTSDRVILRGWFYTPLQTYSTKRPCIIISHGLSCIKEMGLDEVASRYVASLQLNVLVYDHRGFGSSDTSMHAPRQEINTYQQASDLRDAITYIQLRDEVDKDKIALWGYSLAAALSVYVAAIDKRVKAVIAVGPSLDGSEIVKRLAPPHSLNAMQALFETDRLARAQGQDTIRVPIISNDPAAPGALPSPESYQFFSQWEKKDGSTWKNELTVRSLDDISTFALPMAHLKNITPTPVFFGVATRDTNCPIDLAMRHFGMLSEPKEFAIVDADHYELMSGKARELLYSKEIVFLKRTILA